ncbi:hypothetical protein [Nannocystis pusilla]|uniref:hypothetical protein n=1 Tax=Nannocystis pusilla TaxID=889268 RepID=UPI003BF3A766
MSLEGPGLAVFDNKLYCIHRGHGDGHQYLYWSYYNGSTWTADQPTGNHESAAGPAVISYRDKHSNTYGDERDEEELLVVHRGYGEVR